MSLEFLILIGVVIMLLDQIRRLRALIAAAVTPEAQAELDAFEAELTPADLTKSPV